jgi:hypothetical protein
MTFDDLNLDSLEAAELMAFWGRTNSVRPLSFARELFPSKPAGYVAATKSLGHYASNKATAIDCRLRGDIQAALMYEEIADRIYSELPEFSLW